MKAAKKFKQKLLSRRPELMQSIFGNTSRFVQPPGMMQSNNEVVTQRSKSADVDERRPIEGVLTSEGIHRNIDLSKDLDKLPRQVDDVDIAADELKKTAGPSPNRAGNEEETPLDSTIHHMSLPPEPTGRKGQAHDPLEDTLFLNVGNGYDGATMDDGNEPVVSESPGAVSINVYEQAYQEEVDRIVKERSNNQQQRRPTLFLTRRVEDVKYIRENVHLCAREQMETVRSKGELTARSAGEIGKVGFAGLVAKAKSNAQAATDEYNENGLAGLVSKAKSNVQTAVEGYDRREGAATETTETGT